MVEKNITYRTIIYSLIYLSPVAFFFTSFYNLPIQLENIFNTLCVLTLAVYSIYYNRQKFQISEVQFFALLFLIIIPLSSLKDLYSLINQIPNIVLITSILVLDIQTVGKSFTLIKVKYLAFSISILIIVNIIFFNFSFSLFRSPSTIANYLCILLPLTFIDKSKFNHLLTIVVFAAIVLTKDINSILISSLIIFTYFNGNIKKLLLEKSVYICSFIIILSFVLPEIIGIDIYIPGYINGRLFIQKIALILFSKHPILGIGFGKFSNFYNWEQYEFFKNLNCESDLYKKIYKYPDNTYWTFNEYIQSLAELGILGFSVFIVSIFTIINTIRKISIIRNDLYPHFLSLTSFILLSVGDSAFHIALSYSIVIPLILIFYSNYEPKITIKTGRYLLFIIFSSAFMYLIYLFSISFWIIGNKSKDLSIKNTFYDKAYFVLQYNGSYLYEYGYFLFDQNNSKKSIDILEKAKFTLPHTDLFMILGDLYSIKHKSYMLAERNYKIAAYMVPVKLLPKYKLMKLYIKHKDLNKALVQADLISKTQLKIFSMNGYIIKQEALRFKSDNSKID